MKILIVSDSHGNTELLKNIVGMNRTCDLIIHLGDNAYDCDEIKREFPTMALLSVIGNCDLGFSLNNVNTEGSFTAEGRRIFYTHGHRYGGGLRICPVADPTDKSLDMVAVGNMGKLALIGAFMNLKSGKILKHKKVVHKTCKRIKIDVPTPYTVNVDGELYDDIPFEIQIVSDKLRIYRP